MSDIITTLLNEYGDSVYNFCLYVAGNKTDGEDLFQETFLCAMDKSLTIDKNKNPRSYLMSIAVNCWRNTVQKRVRRNRIANELCLEDKELNLIRDCNVDIETNVIRKMTNDILLKTINGLKDKYRIPIILFYSEDMKISEISLVLGKPEGTVKRLLHEAKKNIKKGMEDAGYER